MKKILALALALLMCVSAFAMTSCSPNPEKDWERIQKNGELVVGMTIFEPMNYKDDKGNLIGFDTEFAEAVGKYLGVKVRFEEIDWGQKYSELKSGAIDCIWNGFTSNSSDDGVARADKVDFATGYANNFQCVIVNKTKINPVGFTLDSLKGKTCAVEDGSAGADYAKKLTDESKLITKTAQVEAFTELKAGAVDFIVVDALLAYRMCGQGDFTDCVIVSGDTENIELYAIGCRKNSTLDEKLNEAIKHLMNDGANGELSTIEKLSVKYGVPLSKEVMALKDAK